MVSSLGSLSDGVRGEVSRRLDAIERYSDVRIVFACESGSRAWGFESTDSDYDVRFLYVRRPDWYLSVDFEERPDVLETPIEGDWDVDGWDLRKALRLFRKSSPVLIEWLQSPIVYREVGSAAGAIRALIPSFFSPRAAFEHYLAMAKKTHQGFLQSALVRRKKYFYALRPLLACRWLSQGRGPVPTEFEKLVQAAALDGAVKIALERLLAEKRAGGERDVEPRIPELHAWIEAELSRAHHGELGRAPLAEVRALNEVFRRVLAEAWAATG